MEIAGVTITFTDYDGSGNPRFLNMPDTSSQSVQDVIDTLAAKQAELDNLIYDFLYSAAGKETLNAVEQVGLTLTMNNLQIKFPDPSPAIARPEIGQGNTVAVDILGDPISEFDYTVNVMPIIAKSTSAGLLKGTDFLQDVAETIGISANELIDHTTYVGPVLTKARKRIFATPGDRAAATIDSGGAENALVELTYTAVPDDNDPVLATKATSFGWVVGWTP